MPFYYGFIDTHTKDLQEVILKTKNLCPISLENAGTLQRFIYSDVYETNSIEDAAEALGFDDFRFITDEELTSLCFQYGVAVERTGNGVTNNPRQWITPKIV